MNKPGEALILIMLLSVANYVSGDCLQLITEIDTLDNHRYVVKTPLTAGGIPVRTSRIYPAQPAG
jgi:hypothetical protein